MSPSRKPGKGPRKTGEPSQTQHRTPGPPGGSDVPGLLAGLPARVPADQEARDLIRTRLDDTIVVEAAAGTGKTTMLVERVVALLARGRAEVDRVVAVTFTEKAAGELRLRIRERLESARLEAGRSGQETVRQNLERALARLEEAWVGTIHGFCADLLRERSVAANVDPDYRTLTEPESMKLFRESFDLWLQQTLEDPPEGVRRALRRSSLGTDGDGPVGRLRQAAWALADWRDFPHPWRRDPFPREARIDALVAALLDFAARSDRCLQKERDGFYLDTAKFRRLAAQAAEAESVRARDYDGLEAAFVDLGHGYPPRKGYGKGYGDGVSREAIHAEHAALVAALREFERAADADLAALLHRELSAAIAAYEARKARLGLLDFVDLLVRARDLVRADETVRAEFQERFSHIFVDEFQDTDPIQAQILLLLASDDPSVRDWQFVRPRPGKLFVVGDPKQSIYRFRRADVGIYTQVKELLLRHGALFLSLSTNFRTVENLQSAVNAAFTPWMTGEAESLQADYVPLTPWRSDPPGRPSLVALPVPRPYGTRGVTKAAIDASLPGAVAAFVRWLLEESGWRLETGDRAMETRGSGGRGREGGGDDPATSGRKIEARDICLLFRRFDNFFLGDVTRGYVRALEAQGIRHLLVGGRSFHEREEVEAVRTALGAIEWPDDELAVFATLHGAFFAIGDEELFEFRKVYGKLHPFRRREAGSDLPAHLAPIESALGLLGRLHRERNLRPIADTVAALLEETRAHAGFVLRPSGDQVLANVLHVAEQARGYESSGGISFRGFVEELLADADRRTAPEAPILEEGSDGVRIMTVHRAKGLEFPVVILCDMTANLAGANASRYLDANRRLCVARLAGWSPVELLEHQETELRRDRAEGIRVAYVAATRARDLLVVPAIGGECYGEPKDGDLAKAAWLFPLNGALYPATTAWARAGAAPGCPAFASFSAEGAEAAGGELVSVRPGLHSVRSGEEGATGSPALHEVVWWDPGLLESDDEPLFGVRRDDLMKKDVDPEVVGGDLTRFQEWETLRSRTLEEGARPSLRLATVVERAHLLAAEGRKPEGVGFQERSSSRLVGVEVVELSREPGRPAGARFGALVHALLATVPLDGSVDAVAAAAELQTRLLGATAEERAAAVRVVLGVLDHDVLRRACEAARTPGACLREVPVTSREADGTLLDGVIDLAFREGPGWVVVDFKTDQQLAPALDVYKRQVGLYVSMVARATKAPVVGVILGV